ncbi:MAG: PA2779 family protein [Gammaproteobacteria bacterium]|nr:PA2779 family protein [Gammaproteobacteria bacterium]MDH3370963.1 PA2779 family protein [Gammaproteobacteria bacterium]MDH3407497.1 PA2779 family protein [Gammaproteobacteria bacterium]MDH3562060.1 PA2779 family protein [Gammaproteobacteria bacterium]MDH5487856.1 PA2779 family protein [Gammaproteobacteria bacterium]
MDKLRRLTKPVSHLVVLGMLALSLHFPAANAAMVGTEAVVNAAQVQQSRERIVSTLNRDDVKAQLMARGVDPSQVQARLDSLTDEEVQTLATKMDQLPAGGDGLGVLVFLFVLLLITDIMGFTNIFPFVKHPKR